MEHFYSFVDNIDTGRVAPEDKTKVSVVSHVVAVL